jgi:hypothetical protein
VVGRTPWPYKSLYVDQICIYEETLWKPGTQTSGRKNSSVSRQKLGYGDPAGLACKMTESQHGEQIMRWAPMRIAIWQQVLKGEEEVQRCRQPRRRRCNTHLQSSANVSHKWGSGCGHRKTLDCM